MPCISLLWALCDISVKMILVLEYVHVDHHSVPAEPNGFFMRFSKFQKRNSHIPQINCFYVCTIRGVLTYVCTYNPYFG